MYDISRGGVQKCIETWISNFRNREDYIIDWYCPGKIQNLEYYGDLINKDINIVLGNIDGERKYLTFKYFRDLYSLMRKNKYDIVHINTGIVSGTYITVLISKICKTSKIISHSHSASQNSTASYSWYKKMLLNIMKKGIVKNSDILCACSTLAASFLFSTNDILNSNVKIIMNGIDLHRFEYNAEIRVKIRKRNNADEKIIIGFVGTINDQKNATFALEIYKEIHKNNPETLFWIAGEGPLKESLINKSIEEGIDKNVAFLGEVDNVNELMHAMDALIFPSSSEGLGIVAVEAQMSGLKVFASDAVPKETELSNLISFLSLNESAKYWADYIMDNIVYQREKQGMEKFEKFSSVKSAYLVETLY